MTRRKVSALKLFWIRLTQWEFWPFPVLYFPVNFYYLWLALRNRSLFFFTAANPSIEFGGMLGEKKSEIYPLIPGEYLPEMKLFAPRDEEALTFAAALGYPVIVKPDIGERGRLVEKIRSPEEMEAYLQRCRVDFFVQQLINLPVELSVFYVRHPDEPTGKVTSVVKKDFLKVMGDGKSTVKELLEAHPRAALQLDLTNPRFRTLLSLVPPAGEMQIVEAIGNHCRGTTFLNMNSSIDDRFHQAIDSLARKIEGFHFGRFDLKCASIDDLKEGRNFKIMELNGAGAEPAHIYQPGFPLIQAYRDILWHLKVLAQISRENKRRGHSYWSVSQGIKKMLEVRNYTKKITRS